MFKKAEELKEAGLAAVHFGLDVNFEDLDATMEKTTRRYPF